MCVGASVVPNDGENKEQQLTVSIKLLSVKVFDVLSNNRTSLRLLPLEVNLGLASGCAGDCG